MSTFVVPCTLKAATKLVRAWHRHLPELRGGLFAAALEVDGEVKAVAVAGNPARVWQGTRRVCISRVAVAPGVEVRENACSRLYGALCGAAVYLGYVEAWTYTLLGEPGTSLRAAGFEEKGLTDKDADWSREGRKRKPPVADGEKRRWMRKLSRFPAGKSGSGPREGQAGYGTKSETPGGPPRDREGGT